MEKVLLLRIAVPAGWLTVGVLLFFGIMLWLRPEWLIAKLRRRSPEVLYSIDTDEKVVALTIDDGPDAHDSPQILDILDRYDARATFFLITGHIPGNESLVERMLLDGHELGNHLTADEPSIALSEQEFERELLEADKVLSQFMDVAWVRPGSGWYNDTMLATMKKHGYQCSLGSVYPYDPQLGFYLFSAYYVLGNVKPGAVIVLHDYNHRGERTAKALNIILPALEERGYRVVTLSELAALEQ
ncbi:MAG: chitin deacetylase family protein [Anaerolineales bacterium]|nr:chitin deacetylase family protein [Anaerolineales bacterium]